MIAIGTIIGIALKAAAALGAGHFIGKGIKDIIENISNENLSNKNDGFIVGIGKPSQDINIEGGTGTNKIEEPQKEDKEPTPIIGGDILDKSQDNIENNINGMDYDSIMAEIKQERNERWEREDQIRKETQLREDSAYQRAVEDAQKAGINVNLTGVNPATSGGGITQASGNDNTIYEGELNKYMQEVENLFNENFKGDENDKDRFINALTSLMTIVAIMSRGK